MLVGLRGVWGVAGALLRRGRRTVAGAGTAGGSEYSSIIEETAAW